MSEQAVWISRAEYGDRWPFVVFEGILRCQGSGGVGAVTFEADGVTYALNGTAKTLTRLPRVDPIWADDSRLPPEMKLKKSLGPIIQRGLELCQPPSQPSESINRELQHSQVIERDPRLDAVEGDTESAPRHPLGDRRAPANLLVFLCHASDDKPKVRQLYSALAQAGFEPWLDEFELLPGQDWELEIARAVRSADAVVVCLSGASVMKQGYVQKEIRFALDVAQEVPEGAIFLIPLRLEVCDVPERLRRLQWVDYFEVGGPERLLLALEARRRDLGSMGLNQGRTIARPGDPPPA